MNKTFEAVKPEPYQEEAAEWLSRRKVGMVVAPAGSGKTITAALALSKVIARKTREVPVKIGWLANTIEQCRQAQDALDKFPECIAWADVKIACAHANTDWSDRDGMIIDELHHATATEWRKQIETCKGVKWGFTATPKTGDAERDSELLEMFSHEVFEVGREEVASRLTSASVTILDDTDEGIEAEINSEIASVTAKWKRTMRGLSDGEIWARAAWYVCSNIGIADNRERNASAIDIALDHHNESTLILVGKVEHAQWFEKYIPGSVAAFSKMGKKKRKGVVDAFKAGELKCMIATSLADEGLDVPIASVLILVSGGKSESKTIQRTGRVLRAYPGKSKALIYDWNDDWHPLGRKHSLTRQAIYRKLGYEIVNK